MSAEALIQKLLVTDDQSHLCVVFRVGGDSGMEVLLVADEKGRWSIPGGHAKGEEDGRQACIREVREETGLTVEPERLFLAQHAARQLPVTLYYAVAKPGAEAKPGGGDVTAVKWVPAQEPGELNGTDRLAIAAARSRVSDLDDHIESIVDHYENLGYPVGNVLCPPTGAGRYLQLTEAEAARFPDAVRFTPEQIDFTRNRDRAHRLRQLTPLLDALLQVSDTLWFYESRMLPLLREGKTVVMVGDPVDRQALLNRGMFPDVLEHLLKRLPEAFDPDDPVELVQSYVDVAIPDDSDPASSDCRECKIAGAAPAGDRPCKADNLCWDCYFSMWSNAVDATEQGTDVVEAIDPELDPQQAVDDVANDAAAVYKLERKRLVPYTLELVRPNEDDPYDPEVRCPACGFTGSLLNSFSYLTAGFNGVKSGDPDDLDCYECQCGAKLEYRHLDPQE